MNTSILSLLYLVDVDQLVNIAKLLEERSIKNLALFFSLGRHCVCVSAARVREEMKSLVSFLSCFLSPLSFAFRFRFLNFSFVTTAKKKRRHAHVGKEGKGREGREKRRKRGAEDNETLGSLSLPFFFLSLPFFSLTHFFSLHTNFVLWPPSSACAQRCARMPSGATTGGGKGERDRVGPMPLPGLKTAKQPPSSSSSSSSSSSVSSARKGAASSNNNSNNNLNEILKERRAARMRAQATDNLDADTSHLAGLVSPHLDGFNWMLEPNGGLDMSVKNLEVSEWQEHRVCMFLSARFPRTLLLPGRELNFPRSRLFVPIVVRTDAARLLISYRAPLLHSFSPCQLTRSLTPTCRTCASGSMSA